MRLVLRGLVSTCCTVDCIPEKEKHEGQTDNWKMSLSTYSCLDITLLVQMVPVHCVSQPLITTDEGQ